MIYFPYLYHPFPLFISYFFGEKNIEARFLLHFSCRVNYTGREMGDVFKTLEVFSPSGQTVNIFSFGTDLLAQDGPSCKGQLRTQGSILVCSLESNNSGYELDFLYEHHYLPVKFWWETLGETFSFIKVFFLFHCQ